MNLSDKVTIPAQVMAREVGDETVILDLANGTYYGLDPVGARIWQLMAEGQTLVQVRDVILAEYEVAHEDIERDMLALVQALLERQLVSVDA
ncbi:PqqD family protein [Polaromonas sp.]|uniref:PqqD family protein n=1 Tax=Polaromonas sp. TaxID=1869339 RepID=UPI00181BCC2C|nr:PqqD family protein [Polaromonas sp.]NML85916.1 PqqD family protein [Polaromonas sp.]